MDPNALAQAFRAGQILGPDGPILAQRALLTRKSMLVMTASSVLKFRRPRKVDGYDQGLVSTRYGMTARERWVGRQLSPGIYHSDCVIRLDFDGDEPRLSLVEGLVEGEPVVAMRRLPEQHRADLLLAGVSPAPPSGLSPRLFDPVIDRLVAFHTNAPVHRAPPFGVPERPAARLAESAARLPAGLWPSDTARERFLSDSGALIASLERTFAHRIMEGRVREVHGELRLEHVFLDPDCAAADLADVAIVDPHDGRDSERTLDTAEEILLLGLELELAAGRPFADAVIERYASFTLDLTLRRVAPAYRRLAALRLASIAFDEGNDLEGGGDPEDGAERARALLDWIVANPA